MVFFLKNEWFIKHVLTKRECKCVLQSKYCVRESSKQISASALSSQRLIALLLGLSFCRSVDFIWRTMTIILIHHLTQKVQLSPISGGDDRKREKSPPPPHNGI